MKQTSSTEQFTGINFVVCNYCVHLVRAAHRDGYNRGCELRQNEQGQYARLVISESEVGELRTKYQIDAIFSLCGCENFRPNGLPAHPDVHRRLVEQNPMASSIPVDSAAIETSWDFENKINRYPHKEVYLFLESGEKMLFSIQ